MKRRTIVTPATEGDDRLERITLLEKQLAPAPANSHRRRTLRAALRIEARAYREALDDEQAAAQHDAPSLSARRR